MRAVGVTLAFVALALGACRRPDGDAAARVEAELAGAWVREIRSGPAGLEGMHLRADGSVALLGIQSMNGLAWNVSRDELVISTNTDRHAAPQPSRLRIAALGPDALELQAASGSDYLAGSYRRAQVATVSGVVTYRERMALPAGARVEVRLERGERLLARTLVTPTTQVPIAFALSYLPEESAAGALALEAAIVLPEGPIFATPAPVPVPEDAGDEPLQLLLARVRG